MYLWDAEWPQYATSSRYTSRQVWSKDFRWFLLQLTIQAFLSHCFSWVGIDRINRYWYTHDAPKQPTRYTHAEEEWNKVSRREAHRRLQRAVFKHVFIQPAIQLIGIPFCDNAEEYLWKLLLITLPSTLRPNDDDDDDDVVVVIVYCLLASDFVSSVFNSVQFCSVEFDSIRCDPTAAFDEFASSSIRSRHLYFLCGRSLASS